MTVNFRIAYADHAFDELRAGRPSGLGADFPFYPAGSPDLPKPGRDFLREAENLTGPAERFAPEGELRPRELKLATKAAYEAALARNLDRLHYAALYDDAFTLTVEAGGRYRPVPFVLGHQWGYAADGPREAPVMVVGKNPGREEADARRGFVGPTSILFREILEELGVPGLDDWYMTNVVRFQNPLASQGGAVAAAWIADCLPLLHQEMRLVRPRFMLLLGSEAIAAVLGKGQNYKNTQGRVIPLRVPVHRAGEEPAWHEVSVVTSIHPAAVSHDPSKRDDLYRALRYFRAALGGTLAEVADPEADCEYVYCEDAASLQRVAARMAAERRTEFAIDCEFDGDTPVDGQLHTIQFSWAEKKACVVGLRDERGLPLFGGGPDAARRLLTRIFKGPGKRIIGHYFNADLWWLKAFGLGFLQDQFETPDDDPDPDGVERLFGWQKLRTQGGFDTILGSHAVEETAEHGLKEQVVKHTTMGNYEVELDQWKKDRARELDCGVTELPGFGACPRRILYPYGAKDADGTFRLYRRQKDGAPGVPALLDRDRFGNSSWVPFWISMRAALAFYEMHETGVVVDLHRAEELYDAYTDVKGQMLFDLRRMLAWPDFNPSSPIQCKEFMFGVDYNGKIDKTTGRNVGVRPAGALSLGLLPYKSTGKRPKLWDEIRAKGKEHEYTPSVDKETLEVYAAQYRHLPSVKQLLGLRYIQQITRSVLQPPRMVRTAEQQLEIEYDEDGNRIYERGLLSYRTKRGRVHTNFSQTKDTGRSSSWQPPLQNVGKKREAAYREYAGAAYRHPLRTMFVPPEPGPDGEPWVIISADYTGAELAGMGIQAGSASMVDHCRRALLPTKGYDEAGARCAHGADGRPDKACRVCRYPHPDYYDIHANVAVKAFQPRLPDGRPCREGRLARFDLAEAGLDHYRDAAKPVDFGYAYGMTADAAYRRAREGGADVTRDDSQALLDGLEALYPDLPVYYAECAHRSRQPMWLRNCYGRYRRTYYTDDRKALSDLERQFKNFPIQSLVADAASLAMANFRDYRRRHLHLRYRMSLMIHDDIVLVCPVSQVEEVYDRVIPHCMTDAVDVWPCRLDGTLRADPAAPYHLTPDRHVYLRWGADISREEAEAIGLPLRFAKGG